MRGTQIEMGRWNILVMALRSVMTKAVAIGLTFGIVALLLSIAQQSYDFKIIPNDIVEVDI